MKKILAIITFIATLFLAGCGSTKDAGDSNKNENLNPNFVKFDITASEYYQYRAIEQELGRRIFVDTPVRYEDEEKNGMSISYTFTADTTCGYFDQNYRENNGIRFGFGNYLALSLEEFEALQKYQNETGKQVIYPTVKINDRPIFEKIKYNANIYYVTENPKASTPIPKVDENGKVIPNYWKYEEGNFPAALAAEYNSLRIEGEDGIEEDGKTYFYVYGRIVDGGVEVRVDRYEYNIFRDYLRNADNAN